MIWVMAVFWMIVVVGGFMGVLFPTLNFKSPVELIMPKATWSADDFVYELMHPATAQIHDFLGYHATAADRPVRVFHQLGFGIRAPRAVRDPRARRYATTRRRGRSSPRGMLVISIVPVIASPGPRSLAQPRLSVCVYAAIRLALAGQGRALRAILILIPDAIRRRVPVARCGPSSPIGSRIHTATNAGSACIERRSRPWSESPILGSVPLVLPWRTPNAPSVGTQGQLWLVLFSYGIPGAALFIWWFLYQFWRLRAGLVATRLLVPHAAVHRVRPVAGLRVVPRPVGRDHGRDRGRQPGVPPTS